ncbi:hypothetical protein XACLE20_440063 [Xanthomonas citri pv. citri]|nr:hypothetical protein XACLE20_440063 [Xanthomonas citri pv. citri]CEH59912.1 hypothetical protein XACLE3_8780008 [Xanthomonas citri pv. citri]
MEKETPGPRMAGASVQGLTGFSALQTKPRFSGAFLWALNQGKAERGLGREPRPTSSPPEWAFSGAAQAAFF